MEVRSGMAGYKQPINFKGACHVCHFNNSLRSYCHGILLVIPSACFPCMYSAVFTHCKPIQDTEVPILEVIYTRCITNWCSFVPAAVTYLRQGPMSMNPMSVGKVNFPEWVTWRSGPATPRLQPTAIVNQWLEWKEPASQTSCLQESDTTQVHLLWPEGRDDHLEKSIQWLYLVNNAPRLIDYADNSDYWIENCLLCLSN